MKRTLYAGTLAGIGLFYCTLSGVCQNNSNTPGEIRFRLVRETLIVVTIEANGQGPFDFFLDTGNDTTILDPSLADKLSLTRAGQIQQISVGGRRMVERSRLSRLALGSMEVDGLPVLIEDLSAMRQIMPHIQGIVGQQFLSHFNYLLDYRRRTIRVESGSEVGDSLEGARVTMEPGDGVGRNKIVVAADARAVHQSAIRLVLDSGATSIVLMRDASQRLEVPIKETRWEQTPANSRAVPCGPIHLITLGTEQLHDVTAALSTEAAAPFGDGLLPTSLFQAIYFNNRESFVIFNPKTARDSSHR